MIRKITILIAALLLGAGLKAQDVSVSTNIMGYLNLGTLNLETSYALAQHWSVNAGLKYNPFTFPKGNDGDVMQNRQQSYALGARFWPWHVYSGWWAAARAQYQEYNVGGVSSQETREGDRYGGGFAAGYAYMLGSHFNIEAGAGVWAGRDKYKLYACPTCGRTLESGNKNFMMLNDIILSLSYVF